MTLQDKRIVVTRAPHQALALVEMLRERSAVPLIYPCIDIALPDSNHSLDSALRNLSAYEWLIMTSSNSVVALKRRFQSLQVTPDFAHIKVAVVGEATAEAVESILGISPTIMPEHQSAVGLAEIMTVYEGMPVLLPQSAIAETDLADVLASRGANVTSVEAYRTILGQGGEDVPAMLAEGRVDAVIFTSSSTVTNFLERISPQSAAHIPVACIGASTAATAYEFGFRTVIVPDKFALEPMLDALADHLN